MSNAAQTLLQEIDRVREIGYPESNLMVEVSANHSILCNEKLFVPHIDKNKLVTWIFTVKSSSRVSKWCRLSRVFTLDPYLPEYSIIQVKASNNPTNILPQASQEWESNHSCQVTTYQITLQFQSLDYGSFQQRLVFDFAERPYVYRQLEVVVAPELSLLRTIQYPVLCDEDSELSWLDRYPVVPFNPQDTQGSSKSEYPLPPNMATAVEFGHFDHLDDTLCPEQYRQRLHMLLHIEEYERRRQMTRLTLHCSELLHCLQPCSTDPSQTTIVLPVNEDLMDDASLLIGRGTYALIRIKPHGAESLLLYEVIVESLRKNRVLLRASIELQKVLKSKRPLPASVCFRFVDTYQHMHWALERINLDVVFPVVPEGISEQWSSSSSSSRLNRSQWYALRQMLSPQPGPPLLMLGPFGTGKTRTIAEAIKELIIMQLNDQTADYRILLCTHSNSAADHYIRNYLHPFLTTSCGSHSKFKPLRICWENRFINTVSDEVLQYCLLDLHTGKFAVPSKDDLKSHRVVVSTLVTAVSIAKLDLPPGFFTHIFIDEAAQAMEAETIIPLCLAGKNTQLVFAGDHLQLNPPVMSPISRQLGLGRSLLVRLYDMYPAMSKWKVLLLQNYRSYDDIVEVPSHLFYQDTLIANMRRPPSLAQYSVVFYGVHGQEEIADEPPSFLNRGEAAEVSDRVEELIDLWPIDVWGEANPARICVLAPFAPQVREIRRLLRLKSLSSVQVEGVNNVQGLEFDILFISTVRTFAADTTNQKNLGFLSDTKLLNTAITRARYRLVIIGDPLALCSLGDCQMCWKIILGKCDSNGTFHYRLPLETVVRMARDTCHKNDNRVMLGSHSEIATAIPGVSSMNIKPGPFVNQHLLPDFCNGVPFTTMHRPNALPPGTLPVGNDHAFPLVAPRPFVPFSFPRVPILRNGFQHHQFILPPFNLQPGCGFQSPLSPWVPNQQMPNTSPASLLHTSEQTAPLRKMPTDEQVVASRPLAQKLVDTRQEVHSSPSEVSRLRQDQEIGGRQKVEVSLSSSRNTLISPQFNHESQRVTQVGCGDQPGGPRGRPLTNIITPDESRKKLLSLLESSLKSRQDIIAREQELLSRLKASFGFSMFSHLQENLEHQTSISDKEAELLHYHIQQHSVLQSILEGQDSGNSDDISLDSEASEGGSLFPYSVDVYDDADTDEWFSAQQRDPIVQDYILAFEKLSFGNDLANDNSFASSEAARGNGPCNVFPLSSEDSLVLPGDREDISPLQGWVLQPSESTVYIEIDSIYEEHLEEADARAKIASRELVACRLHIDSFSDGNTATAKVSDPRRPDIQIASRAHINRAFHGDLVAVEIINSDEKSSVKPHGKVQAILKENHPRKVVCRLDSFDKNVMTPINRCNSKFVILQSKDHKGQTGVAVFDLKDGRINFRRFVTETEGKLFLVQQMKWGASYRYPLGFVVHYFPEASDPELSIAVLLAEHGLHKQHVKKTQIEAKRDFSPGWKIPLTERLRRKMFSEVFSVDPDSCVEVDDALSVHCELDGTYKVAVHIADVSFFLPKNSDLDKAAFSRVASVYGSTEVSYHNPMLPSYLGKELCSILPDKEKLAVSVVFHVNDDGVQLKEPEFHRSIVKSSCKLTYEQCQDILDDKKVDSVSEVIHKSIGILGKLSFKMWARRVRQGFVCFDTQKTDGVFSSSKMVEEIMLHTNHAVAKRLLQSPLARTLVPLRCQLPPKVHRLWNIRDLCVKQGIWPDHFFSLQCLQNCSYDKGHHSSDGFVRVDLKTWEKISASLDEKDLGKVIVAVLHHEKMSGVGKVFNLLASVQEHSAYTVSSALSPETQSHFALNLPSYTHFTSPIRRYIDIVVHRILLADLDNTKMPYTEAEVKNICEHCQMTSERVDAFEKQFSTISRAATLRKDSRWRLSKVESLSPECLVLGGEKVDHIGTFHRSIRIHDCKPSSREFLEDEEELILSWNVLEILVTGEGTGTHSSEDNLYALSSSSAQFDSSTGVTEQFLKIPEDFWIEFLNGLRNEDLTQLSRQRHLIDTNSVVTLDKSRCDKNCNSSPEESIAMSSLALHQLLSAHTKFYRKGDTIPVLLGAEMNRGLLRPTIVAVKFSNSLVCCMRHRRNPTMSFAAPALTATNASYTSIQEYQKVMLPLLACEAATASVNSDSTIKVILQNVSIQWNGKAGKFSLSKSLCVCHGLQLSPGDFLCLRSNRSPYIFHCCVTGVDSSHEKNLIGINLVDWPDGFPVDILEEDSCLFSIEVLAMGQSFRRMIGAVKSLGDATELVRSIFLRRDVPSYLAQNPLLQDQRIEDEVTAMILNSGQQKAVKYALTSPLTLIQGPPGTGKTLTGVEIACQLVALNRRQGTGGQVLFCAPSNHAVDVAARMLQTIQGMKVIRIYGRTIEDQTFKQSVKTTFWASQSSMDMACKDIALHFRIREPSNPHCSRIAAAEEAIMQLRKKGSSQGSTTASDQESARRELCFSIQELYSAIDEAERYEICHSGCEIILCTCIEAGGSRVRRHARARHVIIDEASMCLEAETLVALSAAGQQLQQVVLLGDHKQLGAVVSCSAPRRLGLGKSLFEVLYEAAGDGKSYSTCMLQMQYRMHPSIREFPSQHFYGGLLKDSSHLTNPDHIVVGKLPGFWAGGPDVRVMFCHVMGSEASPQDYTGPEGREESKHNPQEVQAVIRIVRNLLSHGVKSSQISVLTPYSAQRAKITRALQTQMNSFDLEVLSVFASQGAERDFIVLSTVRSMPQDQIVNGNKDNQQWLVNHLGFLTDERQMNVALTRAKHGLIIIGNRHLLSVHRMWNSLISHCQRSECLVDEMWLTETDLA
ncbi:3'-5' exoribonuclease HELZ2-like isoform X1 [Montipora foliosa]|uniref:3'-5' exoribonuclease HELZ2-like isoform X1 n=1 Tax=Montipora foliosa TaxID=591990 RepID=UPI0035F14788